MRSSAALVRVALIVIACTVSLASGRASAAIRSFSSDAPAEYHAFVVGGVDPLDTSEPARIVSTLRATYGFRSVSTLLGREATTENIIEGLERFIEQRGPNDSLAILLLLPIATPQAGIEATLVTADPNAGFERGGGMPLFMVAKVVSRARYRQALVMTADCSAEFKSRSLAGELSYSLSQRNSALTFLSYCPPVDSSRQQFAAPGLAGDLAGALDRLGALAEPTAADLFKELSAKSRDRLHFSLENIPPVAQDGFRFRLGDRTNVAELEASVQSAETETQWIETIFMLTQTAHRTDGSDTASKRAMQLLQTVALNEVKGKEPSSAARQFAVRGLGRLPPASSVEPLSEILRDAKDPFVRRAALAELGRSSGDAGLDAIQHAVTDADTEVQQSAIRLLSLRRSSDGANEIARLLDRGAPPATTAVALRALAAFSRPQDTERFTRFLTNPDDNVRREAVMGLRGSTPLDVQKRVATLLRTDRSAEVRQEAGYALGRIAAPNDALTAELLQAAQRGPEGVTVAAFWSVGQLQINAPQAHDALCTALGDQSSDRLRETALRTLGEIRSAHCLEALHAVIRDTKQPSALRITAVEAVGQIADGNSLEVLADAQRDDDAEVVRAANTALERVSSADVSLAKLTDRSDVVRAQAAEQLGKKPDPRAVDLLVPALADESQLVRIAAANSLAVFSDEATQRRLLQLIINGQSNALRTGAAIALRGRDFKAVSTALFAAATDPAVPVRQAVAETLSTYQAEPAANECLRVLAMDPSPAVRLPAVETVTRGQSNPRLPGESSMTCRPVPLLSWDAVNGPRYNTFTLQLVHASSGKRVQLKTQYPSTGIELDGKTYVELTSTARLNADTGVTLLTRMKLDNIAGEHAVLSKFDSGSAATSWFISVFDGHIRFGVYDGLSDQGRVLRTDDVAVSAKQVASIAVTFNVTRQEMAIHVNGKFLPATLEADGRAEVLQIARSNTNVRFGTYLTTGTNAGSAPLMRGSLLEAAYFSWSLPPSYLAALAEDTDPRH